MPKNQKDLIIHNRGSKNFSIELNSLDIEVDVNE